MPAQNDPLVPADQQKDSSGRIAIWVAVIGAAATIAAAAIAKGCTSGPPDQPDKTLINLQSPAVARAQNNDLVVTVAFSISGLDEQQVTIEVGTDKTFSKGIVSKLPMSADRRGGPDATILVPGRADLREGFVRVRVENRSGSMKTEVAPFQRED